MIPVLERLFLASAMPSWPQSMLQSLHQLRQISCEAKGEQEGVVPELQYLPWGAPGMAQLFLAPFYGLCRDRL